ncbi:MAG: recombinase family protein, partial [Alphaproteobacteria bacterium]|nr:recombinase family protein [Alphaproteobacteria bacterium]
MNANGQLINPPAAWPPGTKIFAYLRDSGGTEQELSILRQKIEIGAWAEKHALEIVNWFCDEAKSGRSTKKREHLQSMMEALRNKESVGGVVVWSYDRFARNAVHSILYRTEIKTLGYIFHSLTDYIPEGSEAILFEAFKDYAAEQFSITLSRNVKSGSRAVLQQYGVMGGFPPKGFMREPVDLGVHRDGTPRVAHKWVPDPDLAPTIRLAFEMRARGATLKQIMQATNLFPSVNSFTTFFRNRLYMGVLKYGDLTIEKYCEPIVTPQLWERAQQVSSLRSSINPAHNPRRHASSFLFSGVAFCQQCGSPLNGRVIAKVGRKRREYYFCTRKYRRRDCNARDIPAREFEMHLLEKLEDLSLDIEKLIQFQARVHEHYRLMYDQKEGERLRLTRELRDCTRGIANLTAAIKERGVSKALLLSLEQAEREELVTRLKLETLERQMQLPPERSPAEMAAIAQEIVAALHGDDPVQKKNAIHMLTARVVALRTDDEVKGVLYYIPSTSVFVGSGTPAEMSPEEIHFTISL